MLKAFKRSALTVMLALGLLGLGGAALAPAANAAGFEIYRTNNQGDNTGTVSHWGSTGPNAFCIWNGNGTVHYGVKVCYM